MPDIGVVEHEIIQAPPNFTPLPKELLIQDSAAKEDVIIVPKPQSEGEFDNQELNSTYETLQSIKKDYQYATRSHPLYYLEKDDPILVDVVPALKAGFKEIERIFLSGEEHAGKSLELLQALVDFGDEQSQKQALTLLIKQFPNYCETLDSKEHLAFWQRTIKQVRKFENSREILRKIFRMSIQSRNNPKLFDHINHTYPMTDSLGGDIMFEIFKEPMSLELRDEVDIVFEEFGLDSATFRKAWDLSPAVGINNILALCDLELERPGSAKILSDEFGIRDFARYPLYLLEEQYDNRDRKDRPYGIAIFARGDHNGASYGMMDVLPGLDDTLRGAHGIHIHDLRFIEVGDKTELARALIKLNRRYGPDSNGEGHKIDFALIAAHGNEDSFALGDSTDEKDVVHVSDLYGRGIERPIEFFSDNPTIALLSCSTGADGGIAQQLSEKLGANVIAPTVPASIEYITAKYKGDKISFDVHYKKSRLAFAKGDIAAFYSSGDKPID